ncbi:hypothetical protein [Aquiflexum sp.]|uniref:hypothetical protein n=1 Tax=Aquiflexum sp. TaxID=1872584 RepID=UPI003594866A
MKNKITLRRVDKQNRYLYNQGTGEVTFDTERIPGLNIDLTQFRAYDPNPIWVKIGEGARCRLPALHSGYSLNSFTEAILDARPNLLIFGIPVLYEDFYNDLF